MPKRCSMGGIVILGVLLVVAFAQPRRSISLSVVGFTTNVVPPSVTGLSTNVEFVSVIVRATNRSAHTVSYKADGGIPGYSRFRLDPSGWTESRYSFFCGLSVNDCTLAPWKSMTFEAIIEPDHPCKVGLPYSEKPDPSDNRMWPAWLVNRVRWQRIGETVLRLSERRCYSYSHIASRLQLFTPPASDDLLNRYKLLRTGKVARYFQNSNLVAKIAPAIGSREPSGNYISLEGWSH
jgi:hypothetical protein